MTLRWWINACAIGVSEDFSATGSAARPFQSFLKSRVRAQRPRDLAAQAIAHPPGQSGLPISIGR